MFGWFKKAPPEEIQWVEYKGYRMRATPLSSGSQYQVSGIIEKEIDGIVKSHTFIRADFISDAEQAKEFSLLKGRQIADQLGDLMFSESD